LALLLPGALEAFAKGEASHGHQVHPPKSRVLREVLGHPSHVLRTLPIAIVGEGFTIEEYLSAGGLQQAHEYFEEGGFAGAIGPEENPELSGLGLQANLLQEAMGVAVEGEGAAFQHRGGPRGIAGFRGGFYFSPPGGGRGGEGEGGGG